MKKVEFEARPRAELFVKWVMFTASILGMAILSAFYPTSANVILIVIPSIYVIIFARPVFFEKMKLTTLVVMRILIVLAALRVFNPQIYVDLILLMLIINILEATLTDIVKYKRYYQGVSGIFLALGVIALKGSWAYDAFIGNYYITYGGPGLANPTVATLIILFYAIAYTIWNWIFVTNEFSDSVSLMHVGFLLAPLIGGVCTLGLGWFGGLNMWLLLRANTLSIGGWLQILAKGWFEKEFKSPNFSAFVKWTKKTGPQIAFMIINVSLIIACLVLSGMNNGIGFTPVPFAAPIM